MLLFLVLESKFQIEHCHVFILPHQLPNLPPIFYFRGRHVLCSGGENQEVEVVVKYVDQDKSLMSGTHCSSLLDFSLDFTVETSFGCSLYIDDAEELKRKRCLLSDAIVQISKGRVSPIQSTSRLPWPELSERQQGYYVHKARKVIETAFNCLAPGSEADLWFATIKPMPFSQSMPDDITESLVKAYKLADDRQTRMQILSLFVNVFSKSQLMEIIPGISKRQIDDARRHADLRRPGKPSNAPEIIRVRLDATKTDHFLDFISSSLLQDVSYGTKSLKLDSGDKLLIPAAIRTLIPSRIIKQYQCYCESVAFEPYSERTLFWILNACSASKQVSLQRLDYIATEGAEAFDQLKSVVNVLQDNGVDVTWANSIKQDLKAGKRYLKTDRKTHTGSKERCKDHCTTFLLSDPNNSDYSSSCNHEHDLSCHECARLTCLVEQIDEKLNDKNVPLTEEQRPG